MMIRKWKGCESSWHREGSLTPARMLNCWAPEDQRCKGWWSLRKTRKITTARQRSVSFWEGDENEDNERRYRL